MLNVPYFEIQAIKPTLSRTKLLYTYFTACNNIILNKKEGNAIETFPVFTIHKIMKGNRKRLPVFLTEQVYCDHGFFKTVARLHAMRYQFPQFVT